MLAIDLSYLKTMAMGDPAAEVEMITLLLKDLKREFPLLQRAIEEQQWAQIRDKSHYLKSTFHYIGHQPSLQKLKLIQTLAEERQEIDKIERYYLEVSGNLPLIESALRAELEG
jgi:HPt (histidine-containing phosphotransfer) domain-containing protein